MLEYNNKTVLNIASGSTRFDGVVSGNGRIFKSGNGTIVLAGTNTFTSGMTLQQGTISVSTDSHLGATPGSFVSDYITLDGGNLYNTGILTVGTNRGITSTSNGGGIGVANAVSFTLPNVIAGSGTINLYNGSTSGQIVLSGLNTINGVWNLLSGVIALFSVNSSNNADGGVSSGIGNSSNSASNILINSGATFGINIGTSFGTISTDRLFTINGTNAGDYGTITAPGFNRHLYTNTGATAWGVTNQTRTIIFDVAYDNPATYWLRFDSLLQDNGNGAVSLTKKNTGNLLLTNSNSYTGSNTVTGGYLSITGDTGLGAVPSNTTSNSIILAGGVLRAHSNVTVNSKRGIYLSGGTSSGLRTASSTVLTYNGVLADGGNVTFSSANSSGRVILGGTNTYTGTTTVSSGILQVDGSLAAGSAATVSGGILQGTGTVNGSVSLSNTSGTKILGGTGSTNTGTLSTGALSVAGTTARIEVSCNTSAVSLISVTGDVTITGCTVDFSGSLNAGTYTIVNFTGSRTGSLSIGTLPSGRTFFTFTYNANSITVTFI
jgi:fibronectin-binding autotransporter adhesin